MGKRLGPLALAVLGFFVLVLPAASAHVTVNPGEAEKGGFTKLAFRVPNETVSGATIKVEVFFPADQPIPFVSVRPHAGWTFAVEKTKLKTPVTSDDGDKTTEAVSKITWQGGAIKAGEFDEFEVSAGPLPDNTDALTFKALQTYDNGDVVRWIDEAAVVGPDAAHPAPTLKLVARGSDEGGHASHDTPTEATPTTVAAVKAGGAVEPLSDVAKKKDLQNTNNMSTGALIVGALGLVVGLVALRKAGSRSSSSSSSSSNDNNNSS